jgi:hypothetical protein
MPPVCRSIVHDPAAAILTTSGWRRYAALSQSRHIGTGEGLHNRCRCAFRIASLFVHLPAEPAFLTL